MSWSAITTVKQFSINGLAPEELNNLVASGNDQAAKERDQQLEAAKGAVLRLLVEGGFDNAEEISVSLSGHANEGNKKDPAWADEYIAINLYTKKYRSA